MSSSGVRLEPADPQDLPAAWEVYLACTAPPQRDASRRPPSGRPDLPPRLYAHLLATSEGAFWVARQGAELVGFAAAISRGRLWFLSELWVHPDHRGHGIGTNLFRKARRSSRGVRGRVLAGLAGDDPAACVVGLRGGLLARQPIFVLEGDAEAAARLRRAHPLPSGGRVARYDPRAAVGPRSPLQRLDREVRGGARPQDHVFWMAEPGRIGSLVWQGKRARAYFYVGDHGEVGPVGADGRDGLLGALGMAAKQASKRNPLVRVRVPALGQPALEALLGAGFRIIRRRLLLASEEFGHLDRYLPGDDSLF